MDSQGSVRRNIALKLKDSSAQKTADSKRKRERELDDTAGDDRASLTTAVGVKRNQGSSNDLRWNFKVNLIGRPIQDPLLHICEICSLPVLIYGRMKRCRHAFCRDCAKKAGGICPKCKEGDQVFEEASMGNVYICTHGGGRYDNKGCGRSYLSQRDLEAHVAYRHKEKLVTQQQQMTTGSAIPSSFPLPPFFPPALHRPELGIPPPTAHGFTTAALPPPPPPPMPAPQQAMAGLLPPAPMVSVPQFLSSGSSSFSTTPGTGSIPVTWTRTGVFK